MKARYGIFRIKEDVLENDNFLVPRIMGACRIVRAERLFLYNVVEYTAESMHFKEIEEGFEAPKYRWFLAEDGAFGAECMGFDWGMSR